MFVQREVNTQDISFPHAAKVKKKTYDGCYHEAGLIALSLPGNKLIRLLLAAGDWSVFETRCSTQVTLEIEFLKLSRRLGIYFFSGSAKFQFITLSIREHNEITMWLYSFAILKKVILDKTGRQHQT